VKISNFESERLMDTAPVLGDGPGRPHLRLGGSSKPGQ